MNLRRYKYKGLRTYAHGWHNNIIEILMIMRNETTETRFNE